MPMSTSRLHEPLPCTPPFRLSGTPFRPMSNGTSPSMPCPILNVTRKSRIVSSEAPLAQTTAGVPQSGVTTTSSMVASWPPTPFVSRRMSASEDGPRLSKMYDRTNLAASYASTVPSPSWSAVVLICWTSWLKGSTTLSLNAPTTSAPASSALPISGSFTSWAAPSSVFSRFERICCTTCTSSVQSSSEPLIRFWRSFGISASQSGSPLTRLQLIVTLPKVTPASSVLSTAHAWPVVAGGPPPQSCVTPSKLAFAPTAERKSPNDIVLLFGTSSSSDARLSFAPSLATPVPPVALLPSLTVIGPIAASRPTGALTAASSEAPLVSSTVASGTPSLIGMPMSN